MITPPEGGAAIALSGSMDRFDVRKPGSGVRVIDYKSGREPRDANQEALQLALYLHVATAGDVDLLRRSEAQFAYVTRRGSHAIRSLHGAALAARPGDLAHLVAGIAAGMRSGAFFPQPGPKGEECEFCDYRGVCDARVVAQAVVKQRAGQAAWLAELPRFRLDEEAGT
jgi:RecB family exonuclease